jgi:hypothetical protein
MGRVTRKRLSEIEGDSFVAARILSSGETLSLPSGKLGMGQGAGFCWIKSHVFCSYQKSAESGMIDKCHSCPEMARAVRETDEEDNQIWKEFEEAWTRRVDVEKKEMLCRYDGKPCLFNEAICDLPDEGRISWFCIRKPSASKG